jgi:uncharacterized delta-60 repeat protein
MAYRITLTPTASNTPTPSITASVTPTKTPTGTPCPTLPGVTTTNTATPTLTPTITPTQTPNQCRSYTATKLSTFLTVSDINWTDCYGVPQSQTLEEPPNTYPESITFCAIAGTLSYDPNQIGVVDNGPCTPPTQTPTLTPTNTPSQTQTNTPTNTQTSTPTNTGTPTNTPTPSSTSSLVPIQLTGTGFNALTRTLSKMTGNNKIYIGGAFTQYQGSTQNRFIRINEDGSKDTSFNIGTGFNGEVITSIENTTTGDIYVGGNYTQFTGASNTRLIRLNSDGSKDTAFSIGTGFNAAVRSLALQSDGKLVVGGNFTTYTGSSYNRILRLNTDGSVDTTFSAGTGFSIALAGLGVTTLLVDNAGKILCGGQVTGYNGNVIGNFVRLNTDGSVDTTFSSGTGFNSFTYGGIHQLSNGKYIVTGDFTQYNGASITRVARLNTDGTLDTGYTPSNINNFVESSYLDSQERVYLYGGFTTVSGVTVNGITRLTSGGTYDNTFVVGTGLSPAANQDGLAGPLVENVGSILYGGVFTSYSGQTGINYILRVNSSGTSLRS